MSYLGRVLRKQNRAIAKLKDAPLLSVHGFGLPEIVVVHIADTDARRAGEDLQNAIDGGRYRSLEDFDSAHTADIEFSHMYSGRQCEKYENKTKRNLVELGKSWRRRVTEQHPRSPLQIVVYYDRANGLWSLDTFNYDIRARWDKEDRTAEWL